GWLESRGRKDDAESVYRKLTTLPPLFVDRAGIELEQLASIAIGFRDLNLLKWKDVQARVSNSRLAIERFKTLAKDPVFVPPPKNKGSEEMRASRMREIDGFIAEFTAALVQAYSNSGQMDEVRQLADDALRAYRSNRGRNERLAFSEMYVCK